MKPADTTLSQPARTRKRSLQRAGVVLVLAVVVLVTACAGFQRPDEGASYGDPPVDYQDAARAHLEVDLPIPPGSRFTFAAPVRAYANNGLAVGGEVAWMGYIVDVAVSSPGEDGVYGEPAPYMVFFRNGHVTRTLEGDEHPLVTRMP